VWRSRPLLVCAKVLMFRDVGFFWGHVGLILWKDRNESTRSYTLLEMRLVITLL